MRAVKEYLGEKVEDQQEEEKEEPEDGDYASQEENKL